MKVVVKRPSKSSPWQVWLVQGVQSFRLDYEVTKKREAEWYADQLRHALKEHDKEVNPEKP